MNIRVKTQRDFKKGETLKTLYLEVPIALNNVLFETWEDNPEKYRVGTAAGRLLDMKAFLWTASDKLPYELTRPDVEWKPVGWFFNNDGAAVYTFTNRKRWEIYNRWYKVKYRVYRKLFDWKLRFDNSTFIETLFQKHLQKRATKRVLDKFENRGLGGGKKGVL